MIFVLLILCGITFGTLESAIWNIPKGYTTLPKNSTWCFPRGGKWSDDLSQCVCYKNYYGSSCEHVRNCRFGSSMNHECVCQYGWKGDDCTKIDCKFGVAIKNNTECVCNRGIGGIYCDSCIQRYRSPPNCFETTPKMSPDFTNQEPLPPQCSSNLFNYYLNIFLFVLIAIYFTINRINRRREQQMLQFYDSGPILTPEMELLLAKARIHPDLAPCPQYDEALYHQRPASDSLAPPVFAFVNEAPPIQCPRDEPKEEVDEISVRIYSLHV